MHNVIMREGLIRSLNVVTVDLAIRTGLSAVSAGAAKFGLPKPHPYPSLALGTTEVTPLQIAAAYATFANGGTRSSTVTIGSRHHHCATLVGSLEGSPIIKQIRRI